MKHHHPYISIVMDPLFEHKDAFQNVGSSLVSYYEKLFDDVRNAMISDGNLEMPLLFDEPPKRGKPTARVYLVYAPGIEMPWTERLTKSRVQSWIDAQNEIPLYVVVLRSAPKDTAIPREEWSLPFRNAPLQLVGQMNSRTNQFTIEESERNARNLVMLIEQCLNALE